MFNKTTLNQTTSLRGSVRLVKPERRELRLDGVYGAPPGKSNLYLPLAKGVHIKPNANTN